MNNQRKKLGLILAGLFPLLSATAQISSFAPDGAAVQKLDVVDVTATREKARAVDIAAATYSMDSSALEATGAGNLFEALRFGEGVLGNSMGPGGQSWGGMTSKAILRGAERGTLVLVDGVPINLNGYYNLEDIPLETVARIETVRGASSALYGSEASGGVINIITSDASSNSVSVQAGNHGFQNYSVSLRQPWTLKNQHGGVGLIASYQELGEQTGLSSSGYGFGGSEKRSLRWSVNQGSWRLSHQHVENDYSYWKYSDLKTWARNSVTQISDYEDTKDTIRLSGAGELWRTNVYANIQQRDYLRTSNANTKPKLDRDEDYFASTVGGDLQLHKSFTWAKVLGGVTFEREDYDNKNRINGGHDQADRDNVSAFVRATRDILPGWTLSAGARESYVSSGDLTAFTPQVQSVKNLGNGFSGYVNVGRSFNMPSLKQLYDESGIFTGANADLEPEEGWNYEGGFKWEGSRSLARLSVYHMDFDSISYVYKASEDRNYPQNTPFKNTGVELSLKQQLGNDWQLDLGASYGNPKEKKNGTDWSLKYGRIQGNALLRWQHRWLSASAGLAYLGERPFWKDQCITTFRAAFDFAKWGKLSLVVDNVLNRRDVTTHSSSAYYTTPRSYRVGYSISF